MAELDPTAEELAVQYVMGELRRDDAQAFERRLATDIDLAAEVRRLRGVLGLVPYATVAAPPPDLRARILDAAERLAAVPAPSATPAARAPRRVVWSRFAAAAAAALALAFGLDAWRTRQELALQREVASMLLEPNVVRSFELAGGGAYGTVALDLDAKRGAVVLRDVPALPQGAIYRLWARVADKSVPCGDFTVRGDGTVAAQFVVPVESYTAPIAELFVTVEPNPPGPAPTGRTIMTSA